MILNLSYWASTGATDTERWGLLKSCSGLPDVDLARNYPIAIGRSNPYCNLEQFKTVSSIHFYIRRIPYEDGHWSFSIRDNSTNGTFLDGNRIEPDVETPIQPGMYVSIRLGQDEKSLVYRFDICQEGSFNAKYRRQAIIGKGGFADVYLVKNFADYKLYAMKVLKKSVQEAEKVIQNECNIFRIQHENIARVFEIEESPLDVSIVME